MTILVDHPDPWIGIPEDFPNEGWQSAAEWAAELVDVLGEELPPPTEGQKRQLAEYLTTVAESRAQRNASRIFVSVDGWAGPVYIADLVVLMGVSSAEVTLEQLDGSQDPDAVEKPIIQPFVTESGLEGIYSVRYLNPPDVGGLLARADYLWPMPTGFLQLFTAQFDLVAFERVLPRLAALASTVSVVS
ncbi:MAG: hypothetical protein ABI400_08325 [Lacisediminihabitans sp.]